MFYFFLCITESKFFDLNNDTGDIIIVWKDKIVPNRYYPLDVYAIDISVTPNLETGPETLEVFYGALPPQFFQSSYSGSVFESNQANQEYVIILFSFAFLPIKF